MEIAPIIHTRTYSCDFNSQFIVKPENFKGDDIKWARKAVLNATSDIDILKGERRLVIDNGTYRIAGIVSFLRDINKNCSNDLSEKDKKELKDLFYDDKGRLIYAFIGVVMNSTKGIKNIHITDNDLWEYFWNYIRPIWKKTSQQTVSSKYEEYKCDNTSKTVKKPEVYKFKKTEVYENTPENDQGLFNYYLSTEKENNFSFCSNITNINIVKECKFSSLTTSFNIIARLKMEDTLAEKEQTINDEKSDLNDKENKPYNFFDSKLKAVNNRIKNFLKKGQKE